MKNNQSPRGFKAALRRTPALLLVACLLAVAMLPAPKQVDAFVVPTFIISSVNPGVSVTILTYNFPAAQDFTVRMGNYGTLGIGGFVVGTFNSGGGGSFSATFAIPAALAANAQIAIRMDSPGGYFSYNWFNNVAGGGSGWSGVIPTFSISSVVTDTSVTILTSNFPAATDFTVRMGAYGTYGVGGIVVGTLNSGAGGSFSTTFSIPAALAGSYQIAIRLESAAGYYAYNWFYNNTSAAPGGGIPGYTGYPTFSISSVTADTSVTILTANLPPGLDFTVRMGPYGGYGWGGEVVGTFNSGAGGAQTLTFNIPASLAGAYQVAMRMDAGVYYAYNWFYNNTAVVPPPPPGGGVPGYAGYPTFSISSVVQNTSVTITTANLPPGLDFTVNMGPYGGYGWGSGVVGTFNSGAGGAQTLTFNIPASLAGSFQIAIRMDAGIYYAYNWFYNNNAP